MLSWLQTCLTKIIKYQQLAQIVPQIKANGPAIGPCVKEPTFKKLAIRLILGRSQPEQRIVDHFSATVGKPLVAKEKSQPVARACYLTPHRAPVPLL